ncbi:MAG: VanW family protein [Bacillota bacterium]|nr:VanW family protein [Bacillota bacterium]
MSHAPANSTPALRRRPAFPLLVAVLVASGLVAGVLVAVSQTILPGVAVEGVPVGGLRRAEAEKRLRAELNALLSHPVYLKHGPEQSEVSPGEVGLVADIPATLAAACAPGHRGSLPRRLRAWLSAAQGVEVPLPAVVRWKEEVFQRWLAELRGRHGQAAVEAGWRVLPSGLVEVTPAAVGRDVHDGELRRRLRAAAFAPSGGRTVELPLYTVHPRRSTDKALSLGITEVVARYRTYFDRGDANRTENIRLAAETMDQAVLQPGETFSFNQTVGPRIPDSGYREAPVVVNGRLVPGIGGGVCQVSSTLYNAVLLADLAVVTRHRHSIPSAYVPPGRDATVAYDYFDFRFRNPHEWPVVIDLELGAGWLEARVLGRKPPGEKIELRSEVLETYPPTAEEVPDPELPPGQRVVVANGAPGYRVKVWLIRYRDGVEVERRLVSHDRYQPLRALVRVGAAAQSGLPARH